MFKYYELISNKSNNIRSKIIPPLNTYNISLMQIINLKMKNNLLNYSTNNEEHCYIVNKGLLEFNLNSTKCDSKSIININNRCLFQNNEIIVKNPVLLKINKNVDYTIKPIKNSEVIMYIKNCDGYKNDLEYNFLKYFNLNNNINSHNNLIYNY